MKEEMKKPPTALGILLASENGKKMNISHETQQKGRKLIQGTIQENSRFRAIRN